MDLQEILDLVGTLDDAGGDESARERFRKYLLKSVTTIGSVRDCIGTCLRNSGPAYNRALQDLVNHAAILVGFGVEFGRYAGVQGQIGHDGLWSFKELRAVTRLGSTAGGQIESPSQAAGLEVALSGPLLPVLDPWERDPTRPPSDASQIRTSPCFGLRVNGLRAMEPFDREPPEVTFYERTRLANS